jgi:hypothetical protein
MKIIIYLVILLLYIAFAPLLLMWSLNNLFSLEIAYNFNNWLSVYIIISLFHGITHQQSTNLK